MEATSDDPTCTEAVDGPRHHDLVIAMLPVIAVGSPAQAERSTVRS
jgi:hypothetical protein